MRRTMILAAVGFGGCEGALPGEPEQLEEAVVTGTNRGGLSEVTVAGGERDWTLTSEDGAVALEIHSPTAADLHALDGRSLTFEPSGSADQVRAARAWGASDDRPLWLVYRSGDSELVDRWFGPGFASLGERIGQDRPGSDLRRDLHAAAFETDDGTVELLPGEVDTVTLGGDLWRVGVVAAYHDEDLSGSKCPSTHDYLSYELLRIDAEIAPSVVARAAGRSIAEGGGGCGG